MLDIMYIMIYASMIDQQKWQVLLNWFNIYAAQWQMFNEFTIIKVEYVGSYLGKWFGLDQFM